MKKLKWNDEFTIDGETMPLQDMDIDQLGRLCGEYGEEACSPSAFHQRHIYKQLNQMWINKFDSTTTAKV
jgi:hypothetical protein